MAFWTAVVLHGIIIFGVTIAFPLKPVSRKPQVVFLGAVLEPQDLSPRRVVPSRNPALDPKPGLPLIIESGHSHPAKDIPKPSFKPAIPHNEKTSSRFNFLREDPSEVSRDLNEELGVSRRPPPRPRMREGLTILP